MEISATAGLAGLQRPAPRLAEGAGQAGNAPGQQAKEAVRTAREAGAELPKNAQGVASSAIARGAEPSSVFAALVPPPSEPTPPDLPDPYPDIVPYEETGGVAASGGSETIEAANAATAVRGEEIDQARSASRDAAQAEKLADRRADSAAAEADAATGVAGAEEADRAARDARAETEASDRLREAARREAAAEPAEDTGRSRETEIRFDVPEPEAPAETGAAAQPRQTAAAREPEPPSEPLDSAPPSAADGARGVVALRNAAEAAYAEAVDGLRARAQGETAERVL